MPTIITMIDRLVKLSEILGKMSEASCNFNDNKFWELNKEFDNEIELNKLEDEVNKE